MPTPYWNLLFYANAGTDAERDALSQIVVEMSQALTTDACKISMQLNTSASTTRHWISRGQRDKETTPPVDTSARGTLAAFLDAAQQRWPSRSTMLILCGHGSGLDVIKRTLRQQWRWLARRPLPGVPARPGGPRFPERPRGFPGAPMRWGPSPKNGTFLDNTTLRDDLRGASGRRVDVLGLNACWMGMIEVMHHLRDTCDVQLASQVYSYRWPYGAIVRALSAAPAQSSEQLAAAVVKCVDDEIAAGRRVDTVAALRSGAALDGVAAAVDAHAAALLRLLDAGDPELRKAVTKVARSDDPLQADLASVAARLGNDDAGARAAGEAVQQQLDAARIALAAYPKLRGLQGVSIFLPVVKDIALLKSYQDVDFKQNRWLTLLQKLQA